jgi:NAD(P)-dependent dehydrogenase (short-subunit alcohol dehydrogenase family)
MNRFEGKVALITGASRGIGLAIAQRIVAEGGSVVITARKQDVLDAAVASLGNRAVGVAGKADDASHRAAVFDLIASRFGHLDHLVNNAGINPAYGPLADVGVDVMRKTFEVNVIAALEWVRDAVARGLLDGAARPGSSIVNMASIAGLVAAPGIAFYGVTKGALVTLTLQLAAELAPGIRVNAVAPAVIKTDFARALYERDEAGAAAQYPLKRLGAVEDVAGPVVFLLSDDAAWITGQTLPIDGGASIGSIL